MIIIRQTKRLIITIENFLILMSISNNIYASEINAITESSSNYIKWYQMDEAEKQKTIMPSMFSANYSKEENIKRNAASRIFRTIEGIGRISKTRSKLF